jgi:hypothetical protein
VHFVFCVRKTRDYILVPMPRCPSCGKGFKDPTAVANHMSQPASGCNTWVDNLVSLRDSLRPTTTSSESSVGHAPREPANFFYETEDQMDLDAGDTMQLDVIQPIPINIPRDAEKPCDYFPDAARQYHPGPTFMDKFDGDEYTNFRATNLYYPFASREEWELALWLLRSGLSMRAIDSFLTLPKV